MSSLVPRNLHITLGAMLALAVTMLAWSDPAAARMSAERDTVVAEAHDELECCARG